MPRVTRARTIAHAPCDDVSKPSTRPTALGGTRRTSYGRQRAARRVRAGKFAVHPGWRGRVPAGQVVITDQCEARAWLDHMLEDELWRTDRRRASRTILLCLIEAMDWRTGLITGATREKAAQRACVSPRTVSRVMAWAARVGLLVCVEKGATAGFLGTTANRAPAYVFTSRAGIPAPPRRRTSGPQDVDQIGNPPASCVSTQTLVHEGLKHTSTKHTAWPSRDRAQTPRARVSATRTVLERAGITHRVPGWKACAMLAEWWRAGWCVSGLLYALDHHPDRPGDQRGDAVRGARDPLAVIGHRLAPWRARGHELPESLRSVDPRARRRRAAQLAEALGEPCTSAHRPAASAEARAQARAAFARRQTRSVR